MIRHDPVPSSEHAAPDHSAARYGDAGEEHPLKRLLIRLGLREAFRSVLSEARGPRSPCIAWIWTASSRSTTGMDTRLGTNFLQAIADRLRAVVPGRAAFARVGGDEFVIVQGPILQPDEAEHLAERIDHAIAEPYLMRVGTSALGSASVS